MPITDICLLCYFVNNQMSQSILTQHILSYFVSRWPGSWAPDDYPFMQYMLGMTIDQYETETLYIKARIGNLTFDGVDSPLLHMADEAGSGALGDMLASQVPFDRFGWFYDVRIN